MPLTNASDNTPSPTRNEFMIPHAKLPKPISVASFTPPLLADASAQSLPPLIFTHGASGSMDSAGMANFRDGFARKRRCVCFQGNMNLGSRVKMFRGVVEHLREEVEGGDVVMPVLGGRSMGARAAVIAATELTTTNQEEEDEEESEDQHKSNTPPPHVSTSLILASYPLHDSKDNLRDAILLDLPASSCVLFISGTRDTMCDLPLLQQVREKMKCKSWLVVVEGANHGMEVKPARATAEVGKMTGEVAAEWLEKREEGKREGRVFWDGEGEKAVFGGWKVQVVIGDESEREGRGQGKKNGEKIKAATDNQEAKSPKGKAPKKQSKKKAKDANSAPVEGKQEKQEPKKGRAKNAKSVATNDHTPKTETKYKSSQKVSKRKRVVSDSGDADHVSRRTRSSAKT